jgi:NAD(P)-dependent dehydrogenase (short-subunit alcohol dehydrogenase family)
MVCQELLSFVLLSTSAARKMGAIELIKAPLLHGIFVNAVCPGYTKTDMTSHRRTGTVDSGADTPVWLALQPLEEAESGRFYSGRRIIEW